MALHEDIQLKEIKQKLARYCAYRERCSSEAYAKLESLGCNAVQTEQVMQFLINEKFIDDQRFANAYARGKFNLNHWGKAKIKLALTQKSLSPAIIEAALKEINTEEYMSKIKSLVIKKWEALEGSEPYIRKNKVAQSVMRKGYEPNIVWEMINDMESA